MMIKGITEWLHAKFRRKTTIMIAPDWLIDMLPKDKWVSISLKVSDLTEPEYYIDDIRVFPPKENRTE